VPDVLEVLAEPNRRRILDALRRGEASVGALVAELGSSQPLVSKHLRVLREAGLVEVRAAGQHRLYRLRPEPLAELDAWLEPYRHMWRTSLGRLEAHLTEGKSDD
jgi:DNA-binding transcriptional ArsR family regulator